MLPCLVNYRLHPHRNPLRLSSSSRSHFGTHPSLIPEEFSPFFSTIYRSPFCIPFVFNFIQEWGVCVPLLQEKDSPVNTTTVSQSTLPNPVAAQEQTASSRCSFIYPNGKRCSLPS